MYECVCARLLQNDALMSVASGGTSLDAARAEAVRRDPRAMGAVTTLLIPDEETSGRLNAVKELAISACVSCANRAVTLSADWIAERYCALSAVCVSV